MRRTLQYLGAAVVLSTCPAIAAENLPRSTWSSFPLPGLRPRAAESVPEQRDERRLTAEEKAVKQRLEKQWRAQAPTHRLILRDDDRARTGRVVEERPGAVVFMENWGDSAEMTYSVPRERIALLEKLALTPPDFSYRDIRFQMEFPDLTLYWRGPYTILTDESWFRVEDTVALLTLLHERFLQTWGPLLTRTRPPRGIQVLFFSGVERFRKTQQQYAPYLENPQGFYSPTQRRLVLYNVRASERVGDLRAQLAAEEKRHQEEGATPEQMSEVRLWRQEQDRRLDGYAEEQTRTTIRHEGTHQLFDAYELYTPDRIENDWLIEGLAGYGEGPYPGAEDPDKRALLGEALEADALIPLEQLLEVKRFSSLVVSGSVERIRLAYAQSWGLVSFLMRPENRPTFFDYLRFVNDPANRREVRTTPPVSLLTRFLLLDPDELWRRWIAWVEKSP